MGITKREKRKREEPQKTGKMVGKRRQKRKALNPRLLQLPNIYQLLHSLPLLTLLYIRSYILHVSKLNYVLHS